MTGRPDRRPVLAWLLTPFAAWAVSFLGAWLGARFMGGLVGLLVGGVVGGVVGGLLGWFGLRRVMRKSDERA